MAWLFSFLSLHFSKNKYLIDVKKRYRTVRVNVLDSDTSHDI